MILDHFQLNFLWLFLGIYSKIYDDSIDMYFIKKGSLILEFVKILITSIGLLILIASPNIYTPLFIPLLFIGSLTDWEAYLFDNYWCSITLCVLGYGLFYLFMNFNKCKLNYIIISALFLIIPAIPLIQSNMTINGPIIDFLNISWITKYTDQSEISYNKLTFRIITIIWNLILLLFLNKFLFKLIGIENENLLNVVSSFTYFVLGYTFISVINQFYNLFIDNIHEKRKKKQAKKNKRREKKIKKHNFLKKKLIYYTLHLSKMYLLDII